jgi:hypothetical protein
LKMSLQSSLPLNRARIISPESGIHRPSYNGAPASQTLPEL